MTKVLKTDKKLHKKRAPFTISVFFLNKVFDYISLSLILHLDNVKNLFPDKLNIDNPPYDVYSLGKTIRNKILNCKWTISSIDINDDLTYGTSMVECDCKHYKDFVDKSQNHVLTGDLRIITTSKLRKPVSKGSQY